MEVLYFIVTWFCIWSLASVWSLKRDGIFQRFVKPLKWVLVFPYVIQTSTMILSLKVSNVHYVYFWKLCIILLRHHSVRKIIRFVWKCMLNTTSYYFQNYFFSRQNYHFTVLKCNMEVLYFIFMWFCIWSSTCVWSLKHDGIF